MNKMVLTLVCCAALVACSDSDTTGNPAGLIGGGTGATPPGDNGDAPPDENDADPELPEGNDLVRVGGAVTEVTFDPDAGILNIQGEPFDFEGDFTRSEADDRPGFAAYRSTTGVDPSERQYLAFLGVDATNALVAGVVATPYRLRTEFGGTFLSRGAVPELPTNIQMTHDGDYAAVRTLDNLQHVIQGDARLLLDFRDDRDAPSIEGVIRNRQNLTTSEALDQITLIFTEIDENGNFIGQAWDEEEDFTGFYDGMIAGDGAAATGGVVVIRGVIDNAEHIERGAFIARRQ
ncbi:MAG: hypothetical protein JJU42_11845 [Rhodobacteraceae bacterium]|nr:hypothetical protein [Paracoccaceae bacterium]